MAETVKLQDVSKSKVDLQQWAQITIELWQFKIAQFGLISRTGHYSSQTEPTSKHLIDSFFHHVTQQSGGNQALINFAFNYYIRMLDMGVGKGVKIGDRSNRKRYKVFSKPFYSQLVRLAELLTEQYATQGAGIIVNEFMHGTNQPTKIL
jgi:hypothetical protein